MAHQLRRCWWAYLQQRARAVLECTIQLNGNGAL